jgi:hypothetical protein
MGLFLLVIGLSFVALAGAFTAMFFLNRTAQRNDRVSDPTARPYDQGV